MIPNNKYFPYQDKQTAKFAAGESIQAFQHFEEQAHKRLIILHAAISRDDLMRLPSNRFESLTGNRKGQYSIRINQQWRICFVWPDDQAKPYNIEIVDYHS